MRVAIFTGPTGGHFFPALAFCESLRNRRPEAQILFVTSLRARPLTERVKNQLEAKFEFLPDFPFPRPQNWNFLIRLAPFLIKLAQSFWQTEQILESFRPDLALGFGSYVAFPGIFMSRKRGIPAIIHEQNAAMGKTNQWLCRFATQIALSFEPNVECHHHSHYKTTGLPLRSTLLRAAEQKTEGVSPIFNKNRFRILIVGGSQGAQALNRLWQEALERFSDEEKSKLAVIHITGERDFASVKTMYLEKEIEASVVAFANEMEKLYSRSDLAITRAGAGTLFELSLFGLPAIVIPYPHAEGHQEANAEYFQRRGAIRVLPQRTSTPQQLKEAVLEMINSSSLRKQMSESMIQLSAPHAGRHLTELCEEILENEPCAA